MAPGVDGGSRPGLCDGCGFYRLALKWSPLKALRGGDLSKIFKDSMRCAIVFGDPGLQFALECLQRRVIKEIFGM